jgi:hypothetical protein
LYFAAIDVLRLAEVNRRLNELVNGDQFGEFLWDFFCKRDFMLDCILQDPAQAILPLPAAGAGFPALSILLLSSHSPQQYVSDRIHSNSFSIRLATAHYHHSFNCS